MILNTSKALITMEKGKLNIFAGENEVNFKFPITPTPSLNNNDTLFFIDHTNHDVSRSS